MYKVIIIDDEPIIVEGLSRVVPWARFQCEVVGSANDGQEGLELIRQLHPDIVFSDIYMPKMDGLVLAAAIKSEFENTELTILTGYRDFDLLQRAMHLGVTRFILKPSSMKELEEAVQTMTERLQKKIQESQVKTIEGYDTILEDIRNWKCSEDFYGVKKFAIDQLEQTLNHDHDMKYEIKRLAELQEMTFEEYMESSMRSLNWDVNYHTEELADAQKRKTESLDWYARFKDELNKI